MPELGFDIRCASRVAGSIAGLTIVIGSIAFGDQTSDARAVLARHGLALSGRHWLHPAEVQLRRHLSSLEALDRRHRQAQQQAAAMLEKNEQVRARLTAAEAAVKASGKPAPAPSSSSSDKPSDAKPVEKLNSKLVDVTGLGEMTPLQSAMIELVLARQGVVLASLNIERALESLPEKYQELEQNTGIAAALKQLDDERLGLARDYRRDAEKARQMAVAAQRGSVPVFRECGRFRLGAIVGERAALTMSIATGDEPTLITSSAAKSLGLTPRPDAAKRDYKRGDRTVKAAEVVLPSVRIGSVVLRDVPALLLPPEAEDLASQIGLSSASGYRFKLLERQMALSVEPVGDAASR